MTQFYAHNLTLSFARIIILEFLHTVTCYLFLRMNTLANIFLCVHFNITRNRKLLIKFYNMTIITLPIPLLYTEGILIMKGRKYHQIIKTNNQNAQYFFSSDVAFDVFYNKNRLGLGQDQVSVKSCRAKKVLQSILCRYALLNQCNKLQQNKYILDLFFVTEL